MALRTNPPLRSRTIALVFLAATLAAIPFAARFSAPGWDVGVYSRAIRSLKAGHDPYADGIAVQQAYHREQARPARVDPPWSYVYSPITLPALRLIGALPAWLSGGAYWLMYAAGTLAQLWVAWLMVEEGERRFVAWFAPVALFFPGLLVNEIVLGGNVAYILYGVVLVGASIGWRRGQWRWFYAAVLAASCVKAPMLTLVAIPLLSARRQWIASGLTAGAGVALFLAQPLLWPALFRHYLEAVELQFSFNRDFGSSPAGIFSGMLYDRGLPYSPASIFFYLSYAIPLILLLHYFSRQLLAGYLSLKEWAPVLLTGVVLLNPRIIEYDLAPITVPLLLLGWRFLGSRIGQSRGLWGVAVSLAIANAIALRGWGVEKMAEALLLALAFTAGSWTLRQSLPRASEALDEADFEGAELTPR